MSTAEPITLSRDCEVIQIPSGVRSTLPAGSTVRLMQSLGTSYTIVSEYGYMYRLDARDEDAIGLSNAQTESVPPAVAGHFQEQMVWNQLKTVYDPEIPVNIADLGLIYSCVVTPLPDGGKKIDIKMSMTAPGCGMGDVLKAEVEGKLSRLPEVKQVQVEVVFDPPWHPGLMSDAAKLQLGFDLDYGAPQSETPIVKVTK